MNYNEFIETDFYPDKSKFGTTFTSKYKCKPTCKKNKGYKILKNISAIKYNNENTYTNETSTIVYTPDLTIKSCYNCKCCKFIRNCCFYHLHFYYSQFTICNKNEFPLYNAIININVSSGLTYIKRTLKINNKRIDDTEPIVIDKIESNEIVKISFLSYSSIINNKFNMFLERFKINCFYLGFNNTPKYFNKKKYMLIS